MTALEEIKKAEHERIWLEPAGAPDRCWCQDNQWGDEGVEYVLASTLESLQRENEELNAWKAGVLAAAHLITVFADDMNERNLDDKRAYIKQQTGRIRAALPVAYVCAADMELLGKSSDGWDFSMSPKPRPDLGMNMALYAAPLTEASRDPVLWVSPVDLRAWQKAKAGEIWASSENLEGECIPLYTALASRGGNTMQSEIVEKCVKSAMLSVIKEHPIGHWNDDQVEKVARRAITEAAISAQVQDVAIPEGWQLVPVEPTAGMIEAAKSTTTAALTRSHANEIYRAMLAAAPEKQEGC